MGDSLNRNNNIPVQSQKTPVYGFYRDPETKEFFRVVTAKGGMVELDRCCPKSEIGLRVKTNLLDSGSFHETHSCS